MVPENVVITKPKTVTRKEKVKTKQNQIDEDDEFLSFKKEPKPKRASLQPSLQVCPFERLSWPMSHRL